MDDIDFAAVAMLIENHWDEFVEHSGDEESARRTLDAVKDEGGLA